MKHTRIVLLLLVMVFALAFALTSCKTEQAEEHEHTWVDATCEAPRTCSECGETEGEALGHAEETIPAIEVACTESGFTEGKKCSVCDKILVAPEEILPKGHPREVVPGTPATCTEPGLTDGEKCSVCDQILVKQKEIPAGHTAEVVAGNAATCTETGLSDGKKCSVCGETLLAQEVIPALGHTDENNDFVCDVCEADLCTEHTEEVVAGKAASCTESGLTEGKKCSNCGEVILAQEVIPALGHDMVTDAAVAPDCTNTGLTEGSHCSRCDHKVAQEVVPALGHTEEVVAGSAANCTESGLTEGKKCSVCGETLLAQEVIPALGHDMVTDAAVAPDCTNTGLTEGSHCTRCDHEVAQELVPALGHKDDNGDFDCDACGTDLCTNHVAADAVEENRKAATCTEAGSYDSVVKCSNCHEELSRETIVVSALGHTEEALTGKDASCTEAGLTAGKKCSVCGETLVAQEEIPALGHDYETTYVWADDCSTCTASQICKNDASHVAATETATVSTVKLNVSANQVIYTYNVEFANGEFAAQTKAIEGLVAPIDNVATINAPAIAGRVASHDYVKFGFHDAAATYEFTIYYSEVDVWDGTSVSESLSGSGTAEDPYLIQSAADFAYFAGVLNAVEGAAGVNYKVTSFKGQYLKMTKSIDLNGYTLIAGQHTGWNNYQGFFGTFDGNNCTIRGIYINNDTTKASALFGCIASGASVKNLSLYGEVNGRVRLSGLAGYLLGTVDNITSYVELRQRGAGNETGTVGGIVANQESSSGAITNCVNYGNIVGESYIFGGIAGSGGAAVTNCTNWGSVTSANVSIGGIFGSTKDKGTISGCVNYGIISSVSTDYGQVGGIVGSSVKPISNCVNYGDVFALLTAGGIAGNATKEISGCANYGRILGASCTSTGLDEITSSNVTKNECTYNGYVELPEHEFTHFEAKAATCTEAGNVAYDYCSECNKNYNAEGGVIANVVIAAKGHSYVQGEIANGKIPFTCSTCGDSYSEDASYTVTVNHLNLDGSVAAQAESFSVNYDAIYTVYAKSLSGYVASHDYVKLHVTSDNTVNIYYSEVNVWDGTGTWNGTSGVATSLASLGGSGTQADPYIIDEAQDLVLLANIVNSLGGGGSSSLIKGKYFKMTKSIDLNNYPLYIGGYNGWGDRRIFDGHLDGNNCTIRGINNDRALFGCIEGSVNNLSLYGQVNGTAGSEASLVGYLRGTVHYITNYVNVTGHKTVGGIVSNVENKNAQSTHLTNYGTINVTNMNGAWSAVGGIFGCFAYNNSDLVNWGDIYCDGTQAGGIGGYCHNSRAGTVSNAYNYGTVYSTAAATGQILGTKSPATYENCYEYGKVVASLPTEE